LQVRGTGVNNQGHEWEKYNRKPWNHDKVKIKERTSREGRTVQWYRAIRLKCITHTLWMGTVSSSETSVTPYQNTIS
jgi:hypothetical protein